MRVVVALAARGRLPAPSRTSGESGRAVAFRDRRQNKGLVHVRLLCACCGAECRTTPARVCRCMRMRIRMHVRMHVHDTMHVHDSMRVRVHVLVLVRVGVRV